MIRRRPNPLLPPHRLNPRARKPKTPPMAAVAQMPVEPAPVVADAVDEQLPVRAGAVVDEPPADAGDAVGTPPPAAADGAEAAAAAMPVVHPPPAPAEQKVVTPALCSLNPLGLDSSPRSCVHVLIFCAIAGVSGYFAACSVRALLVHHCRFLL